MTTQVTYTSKMDEQIMQELSINAKKLKKHKKDIIEEALKKYFTELRRQEYIESFKRANKDEELKVLANFGLKDYNKQLKSYEK